LKFIEKTYVFVYPVFIGLFALYPSIADSTIRYLKTLFSNDSVFKYSLDIPVLIIWAITILWAVVGINAELKKDRKGEKEHEEIKAAIISAPNFESFGKARVYLNKCVEILRSLDVYQSEFSTGVYKNIGQIEIKLQMMNILTKDIVSDFFNIDAEQIGVNYMLFLEKGADNDCNKAIENVLAKKLLYYRKDESDHLLGVLYLRSELRDSVVFKDKEGKEITSSQIDDVVIPIYDIKAGVYNADHCRERDDITLPGAPTAFFKENSIIGNTLDKSIFQNFDEETKNEVLKYFQNIAVKTRSVASFRIPDELAGKECVGIFNVETPQAYSFKDNERIFSTLYTMLYPSLKLTSKYLVYYRKYLIDRLKLK
jgi:hypothetical protein